MILFLFYLVSLPLAFRTISISLASNLLDYSYYLKAGSDILHGINPYTNLLYPPASLFLFIPLSQIPFPVAKVIWTTLSLLAFYLGLYLFVGELGLTKYFPFKISRPNIALVLFLLFLQTFPVKFSLAQGQINFFVFLGFSLFNSFLNHHHDLLAGLTVGLITILKFNPVFYLLYFLILKKTKSIYVFLLVFIVLNLLIDLIYPHNLNISFVQNIQFMSANYSGYYFNQSLAALFSRYLPIAVFAHLVTNTFSFLLWATTLSQLYFFKKHSLNSFLLFIVTILLTSPLTWQHHLIWTILVFIYLFVEFKKNQNQVLLTLSAIAFLLINLNLKDPQSLNPQNLLYSHATFGLLLLYSLILSMSLIYPPFEES
ncbi:MAG TPA: glycosyltransferase family 87 protein [Patescibacteria group bacterium]